MEAFLNSFVLVFLGEMGDKTQLLSLMLTARYKKPWLILLGVFIATIANHALASWAGHYVATFFSPTVIKWVLAITFFGFGLWILVPDKEEEIKSDGHLGILMTTIVAFFIAEMGDKTQLATIALGATYRQAWTVTFGTTAGMMASNALAIFLGPVLLQRIQMKYIRLAACLLFMGFGVAILIGMN
jgi:Ca2+/H+ antiporter, TMEM165/GDT1 family